MQRLLCFLFLFFCFASLCFCESTPAPDESSQKSLADRFLSLQTSPEFFRDSRCRIRVRPWEVKRLYKKAENFGKDIFMKSWSIRDMEKSISLFGRINHKRSFNYFPEQIADGIGPYIDSEVSKLQINRKQKAEFDEWFELFKRWGLSYFCFSDRNLMVIVDGQNGNYFQLGQKAFFIEEKYQRLIDIIIRYKERSSLSNAEQKRKIRRKKDIFRDLDGKYLEDSRSTRYNRY